jgi:DNA polymerase I-like protein with 3'-5' exonuclease and polymerase domains
MGLFHFEAKNRHPMKTFDPKTLLNVTVVHPETVAEFISCLTDMTVFGWDTETTVTKTFFDRKMRTMQFGNHKRQFFIDLLEFCDGRPDLLAEVQGNYGQNLFAAPKLKALLEAVRPFLCSNKHLKVGVNLGFEYTCLYWGFGISTWGFYGCDIVERVRAAGSHSLEDFSYFSLKEMMERYCDTEISKELQTSFNLTDSITQEQIEYACLDVRLPIAIRYRQLNGYTRPNGSRVPSIVEEGLARICQIENDCIMSFEQFHIHGEKIDRPKWKERVDGLMVKRSNALIQLDSIFIPHVGCKVNDIITDAMVEAANEKWRAIKDTKDPVRIQYKAEAGMLGKKRTWCKDMLENAQGEALINYGSPSVMLKALREYFPELRKLKSTNDEDMQPFGSCDSNGKKVRNGHPAIDALRDYREFDKQITTYGYEWITEWSTHPCNDEGWLSPFDGKLHSRFNQLAAETGRSSSDNPNGQNLPRDKECRKCFIAEIGEVYVTCDMSGAELRILAELSSAAVWIEAFAREEDVHSVCCEILFPTEWLANAEPDCMYYALNAEGDPRHQKCKCKKHNARRDVTKTLNFGIAYGMVAATLARRANISIEEAELVIDAWMHKFADIWAYLKQSGRNARKYMKAFDMFGRRRTFLQPTREKAREKVIKYWKDSIAYAPAEAEKYIAAWMEKNKTEVVNKKTGTVTYKYKRPVDDDKFWLTHREPTETEITKAMRSMMSGIERQGKNLPMQATNVSIAKLAMGCGFDPQGKPYLFHILPQYDARLVKFVHDELVTACPEEHGTAVAKAVADAFKRAAAEVMTKVTMEAEFNIAPHWAK